MPSPNKKYMKLQTIRLEKHQVDFAKEYAKQKGKTVSEAFRDMLDGGIIHHAKNIKLGDGQHGPKETTS